MIGGTIVNFYWRRISEERNWDAARSGAFQVRELHMLADREVRKRKKIEAEAYQLMADTKEYVGDLLAKVNRQAAIIENSRNRKIQRLVRLSKGWRTVAWEKFSLVLSLWPGGNDQTTIAWENWPIYSDDRRVSVS